MRRFGLPIGLVLLTLVLVLARLYDVQVREHRVWASEAAALERSETILPHTRGAIYDRKGRLWVADEVRYELEFVWRDFRRGHPLGNLAALRSLLDASPVRLSEAAHDAGLWAEALVQLTPQGIRDFAQGKEASGGRWLQVGALPEEGRKERARAERRPARAAAVHFYLQRLLGVTGRERGALRQQRSDRPDAPYLELVARVRQGRGELLAEVLQRTRMALRTRIDASLQRLEFFAYAVDWTDLWDPNWGPVKPEPGVLLLEVLERARREAEDAAADRLFAAAAGFRAGRLSAGNLSKLDLGWLRRCVYWDEPRLAEWIVSRGNGWVEQVENVLAGHVFARFKLKTGRAPADRVLDALAHFFAAPEVRPIPGLPVDSFWESFRELEVLEQLPLAVRGGEDLRAADLRRVLPLEERALRRSGLVGLDLVAEALWSMQDMDGGPSWAGAEAVNRTAEELIQLAERAGAEWQPGELEPIEDVLLAWDDLLQMRIGAVLGSLPQPVAFSSGRLRGALEARNHVVKDMDARPRSFSREPSMELVHLVGRYPADFAGFQVRSVTDRVPVALSDWARKVRGGEYQEPRTLFQEGLGLVRSPQLVKQLEQRPDQIELDLLQNKLELQPSDERRIYEITAETFHSGQAVGSSGIEGYLDPELSGLNGYREVMGLQEQSSSGRPALFRPPSDGKPVTLTLDTSLQRAGEWVINHPEPAPAGDSRPDDSWTENPVGAVVLMDVEGPILCAASAPLEPGLVTGGADGQAAFVLERTLRQPGFHPAGSIIKPLVAAFGLQFLGLDPNAPRVVCSHYTERGKPGWGKVDCHSSAGHTLQAKALLGVADMTLSKSMAVSCNTYFAQLGETLFDGDEFHDLFRIFGLGEPSGVRSLPLSDRRRGGLREEYRVAKNEPFTPIDRQRLANGLVEISTTPVAMGRAYCGLATGMLPEAQLIAKIGGRSVLREPRPLGIDERHLVTVREAMLGVTDQRGGSAHDKGLSEADLGFRFVCKTGSADYVPGFVPPYGGEFRRGASQELVEGMRKHTWVAGWFPAEAPRYVLVVYVHDTATTSSHSAVFVASQFLREPAVQQLMAEARAEQAQAASGETEQGR